MESPLVLPASMRVISSMRSSAVSGPLPRLPRSWSSSDRWWRRPRPGKVGHHEHLMVPAQQRQSPPDRGCGVSSDPGIHSSKTRIGVPRSDQAQGQHHPVLARCPTLVEGPAGRPGLAASSKRSRLPDRAVTGTRRTRPPHARAELTLDSAQSRLPAAGPAHHGLGLDERGACRVQPGLGSLARGRASRRRRVGGSPRDITSSRSPGRRTVGSLRCICGAGRQEPTLSERVQSFGVVFAARRSSAGRGHRPVLQEGRSRVLIGEWSRPANSAGLFRSGRLLHRRR